MASNNYTHAYQELTQAANDAGLMDRRRGFYWVLMTCCTIALTLIIVAMVQLAESWFQLILAALLALVMAQFAFLGHDSAHQAIFSSGRWNEWTSRVLSGLVVGISYEWWKNKHNQHHANPNQLGVDPDVKSGVLAFTPEATDARTGLRATLARRQGYFFIPLLFLEGFYLHYISVRALISKRRWLELSFISARIVGYLVFVFLLLPPGMAAAFVGVQVGLFGLLLGGAFAPNHIGMPTVAQDAELDFLRRQVLMSRNIRGGALVHFFMGGLEYQIEHHLFPMVPRPNLRRLQRLARDYCDEHDVPYTETSLTEGFANVLSYLNQVGLKNRDPWTCPLVRQYRS